MKNTTYWCTLFLSVLLLTLGGTLAHAKNPAPYVTHKGKSYEQVFYTLKGMPANAIARKEFFRESEKNLGLNEKQLEQKIKSGQVRAEACGNNCSLKSAGLENGTSKYWREVKQDETVVFVYVNEQWKPWFLVRCGNPVAEQSPAPPPPQTTFTKKDCCWHTGPPIVIESAQIGGGAITAIGHGSFIASTPAAPRFVSVFYPTSCSGESFNEKQ